MTTKNYIQHVASSTTRDYTRIMQKPKKLAPIAIRLDPDVKEGLEMLAKADDRSLSAYVHRLLKQHVERELRTRKSKA